MLLLVLGAVAWVVTLLAPGFTYRFPYANVAAALVALAGLALNLLPKIAFQRAGTTVNPLRPDATTQLVTSGIYRYTRNPMYLGHAMILSGWVAHLGNALVIVVVPAFVLYVTVFQIKPEERLLSMSFPHYKAFCRCSPRWLWPPSSRDVG